MLFLSSFIGNYFFSCSYYFTLHSIFQCYFDICVFKIIDFRDAEVQRLDAKITAPLSQYATICKHARDDVKSTFAARDRELTRRRQLDKVRERNPRNHQMIVSF